ncbi:Uncharacterized protein OBRU01_01061, partial [Operophtera brumata]
MAPDTGDEWTEMKCIQLMREFRKQPILWDQKYPLFYKKKMKPGAWIEISKVLHMPPDSCRHKMVILMSSFRREKAKVGILDDEEDNEINIDVERTTTTGAAHLPVGNHKRLKKYSMENHEQDMRHTKTPKISVRDDSEMEVQFALGTQHRPTTSQHNEDEIKYFSNFIASKMMKYSEATKNAVQQAICEVIFKADQNYYEETPKEHFVRSQDDSLNQPS